MPAALQEVTSGRSTVTPACARRRYDVPIRQERTAGLTFGKLDRSHEAVAATELAGPTGARKKLVLGNA